MALGITPKQDSQLSALFSKLLPFNMHQLYLTRRREWQPTRVFLPGESHGQRSVAGIVHEVTRVGHDLAMVKNLPIMRETWVWSLGWEDSLEFPGGVHGSPLQYSCLENPHGQWYQVGYIPWGHRELDTTERQGTRLTSSHFQVKCKWWRMSLSVFAISFFNSMFEIFHNKNNAMTSTINSRI